MHKAFGRIRILRARDRLGEQHSNGTDTPNRYTFGDRHVVRQLPRCNRHGKPRSEHLGERGCRSRIHAHPYERNAEEWTRGPTLGACHRMLQTRR